MKSVTFTHASTVFWTENEREKTSKLGPFCKIQNSLLIIIHEQHNNILINKNGWTVQRIHCHCTSFVFTITVSIERMVLWDETEGENDSDAGMHAALTYDQIAAAGPSARPLEFPTPSVHRGERCFTFALDHRTGRLHPVKNVLMRVSPNSHPPTQAYLIKKTLSKSVYGVIKSAVVLKRRNIPPAPDVRRRRSYGMIRDEDVEWESTEELAVVKVSAECVGSSFVVFLVLMKCESILRCLFAIFILKLFLFIGLSTASVQQASRWAKIRHLRGRHLEDPIKEVSAMQLVGNYHPNVVGSLEVLQDDEYLYAVMKMCSGGDLFERVMGTDPKIASSHLSTPTSQPSPSGSGRSTPDSAVHGISEDQARIWFRQLLMVSLASTAHACAVNGPVLQTRITRCQRLVQNNSSFSPF